METIQKLIQLGIAGGVFMIPLVIVAVVTLALVIERLLFLRENTLDWDRFHFELKSALKDNDLERGIVLAARTKGIVGRVMQECLLRVQAGQTDVERATEKEVLSEMASLERSRGWLNTMIQIAPLLGLLGTVQGMIMIFMTIEQSATMDPRMFAGGIYTKLVTTFTGLMIAVPAYVAQEHIRRRVNIMLHHLDLYLLEVRDWTERRTTPAGAPTAALAEPRPAGETRSVLHAPGSPAVTLKERAHA